MKFYDRKVQTTLVLCVVLGLGLLGGAFAAGGLYVCPSDPTGESGQDYLAKPDPHKALLCLQLALRHNNRDVEACRLMAQLGGNRTIPRRSVLAQPPGGTEPDFDR